VTFHIRSQIPKETNDDSRFEERWKGRIDNMKYLEGRDGDHILAPFECEICIFIKLKGRYPQKGAEKDALLCDVLRRANLDVFWSRERATIANNVRNARKLCKMSAQVGMGGPFLSNGPMPSWDYCGYEVAVGILLASKEEGRHSKTHTQFRTLRHLRTAYSNFYKSSSMNAWSSLSLESSEGANKQVSKCPTNSIWFTKFMNGLGSRMGEIHKPNLALSTAIIKKMTVVLKEEIGNSKDKTERFNLIVFGFYIVISYVLSLRGSEGLMVDLSTLIKGFKEKKEYLLIGLKGKIKGETIERNHLFPCSKVTSSGLEVELWAKLIITTHKSFGREGGPAITDSRGDIITTSILDRTLHDLLIRLYDQGEVFPAEVSCEEDISDRFSVYRSLRRASDTRAINKKVSSNDIDVVNRWKRVETGKGRKFTGPMRQHYAEVSYLIEPFLRYTYAM